MNPGPYDFPIRIRRPPRRASPTIANVKTAVSSRLESLPVPCFHAVTPVSNRRASRLEFVPRNKPKTQCQPGGVVNPPPDAFSRLEIAAPGFMKFVPSTRRRWPALAPGNMSFSPICTDSARTTLVIRRAEGILLRAESSALPRPGPSSGEPAPRQETADY